MNLKPKFQPMTFACKLASPSGSPHFFIRRPVAFKIAPKQDCDDPVSLDDTFSREVSFHQPLECSPKLVGSLKSLKIPLPSDKLCPSKPLQGTGVDGKVYPRSWKIILGTFKDESSPLAELTKGNKLELKQLLNGKIEREVIDLALFRQIEAQQRPTTLTSLKSILAKSPKKTVGSSFLNSQTPKSTQNSKKVTFALNKVLFIYKEGT